MLGFLAIYMFGKFGIFHVSPPSGKLTPTSPDYIDKLFDGTFDAENYVADELHFRNFRDLRL